MDYQAVIVDFDGINRKVLPQGLRVYLRGIWRLGFWRTLELLEFVLYLIWQEILAYGGLFLGVEKPVFHPANLRDLIPGSRELLRDLKEQGYPLAMVTNRKRRILKWHCARLDLPLEIFDHIATRDGPFRKPDPRVFDSILDIWQLSPQKILYVCDRYEIDYLAAKARGLPAVLVCSAYTTRSDFLKLGVTPEEIIDSIASLPEYLAQKQNRPF